MDYDDWLTIGLSAVYPRDHDSSSFWMLTSLFLQAILCKACPEIWDLPYSVSKFNDLGIISFFKKGFLPVSSSKIEA